jgi:hypothetical protein
MWKTLEMLRLQGCKLPAVARRKLLLTLQRQEAVLYAVQQNRIDRRNIQAKRNAKQHRLLVQGGIEQRWVVGVDGEGHAGRMQARQGVLGQRRIDTQA